MYSKQDLINYRIEKAIDAHNDAELLFNHKSYQSCANRLYYSLYYVISAHLIHLDFEPKSHAGIKILFHKELIKTEILEKEVAVVFEILFNLRNDADYIDFIVVEEKDVVELLPKSKRIIENIKVKLLKNLNY